MGKTAITPSSSVAKLLHKRRRELGLSLRQVEEQTDALGEIIPFTTVGKIEQGRVEPGLRRLHVLLRVYDLPAQLAHELIELEQFAGDTKQSHRNPRALYDEGKAHWEAGELREGLACLLAVKAKHTGDATARLDRQRTILSFAATAGSLGRNRLSKQIVDELLLEPPESELLVPVLIQVAVCWRRLGSGDAALGFLARASACLEPDDLRNRAWVHHSRASTYASMGTFGKANTELTKAISAYRAVPDPYGEGRALCTRVSFKLDDGDAAGALRAARAATAHADRHEFGRLKIVARIDEARVQLELGDPAASITRLKSALSSAIDADDHVGQFYAHYYLWKCHTQLGHEGEAEHALRNAQYYVRFTDESAPQPDEIRATLTTGLRRRRRERSSATR